MITGKTILKRDVVNYPRGEVVIGTIPADVEITATENVYQWLHLAEGGWVNAGARQQYIKWQVVPDEVVPDPVVPEEIVPIPDAPAPEPAVTGIITEVKRQGKIATLLVDWQNPKWNFAPRQAEESRAYPHTVTFNSVCDRMKGPRIPLTDAMLEYLGSLNGERTKERILKPPAGWINNPTDPPTVERLTWAANHVVVRETRLEQNVEYSNVYASNCHATDLNGMFFDKDMRLIVHKFNALTNKSALIKLGRGHDCYTPFITDPDENNGDMWIRSDYLEMWPELPFTLSDGSQVIEYELYGFEIYGLRADGSVVLLRDRWGFKTNWQINSPELPV
jgi:hypothetical protein